MGRAQFAGVDRIPGGAPPPSVLIVRRCLRLPSIGRRSSNYCHSFTVRKPTFRIGTKSRATVSGLAAASPRNAAPGRGRVTKSAAARFLGISRRTVIRYVSQRLISEDRKGRVRLFEIAEVLRVVPISRGLLGSTSRCRYANTWRTFKDAHRRDELLDSVRLLRQSVPPCDSP